MKEKKIKTKNIIANCCNRRLSMPLPNAWLSHLENDPARQDDILDISQIFRNYGTRLFEKLKGKLNFCKKVN